MVSVGSKRSCMVCRLGPGIVSFVDKRLERDYSSRSLSKAVRGLSRQDIDRHAQKCATSKPTSESVTEEEKSAED
jgi:hypothetical protein